MWYENEEYYLSVVLTGTLIVTQHFCWLQTNPEEVMHPLTESLL